MKNTGWTWLPMRMVMRHGQTALCSRRAKWECDGKERCRDVPAPNAAKHYFKRCRKLIIEVRRAEK